MIRARLRRIRIRKPVRGIDPRRTRQLRRHWTPAQCYLCRGRGFRFGVIPCRECDATGWLIMRRR